MYDALFNCSYKIKNGTASHADGSGAERSAAAALFITAGWWRSVFVCLFVWMLLDVVKAVSACLTGGGGSPPHHPFSLKTVTTVNYAARTKLKESGASARG